PIPAAASLPAAAVATARAFLSAHQLAPARYAVCAAAGFANVRLKTWPADLFAAALRHLHERHGLRTLLVGHESERAHLESLLAGVPSSTAVLWLGRENSLPTLAGLIADASLYLGNDTGAMHLAAALDVPVVAVFGGGTWPRFVPAARRGLALVQPLPCFGCGWDCAFGDTDAPCLAGITISDTTAALDAVLARPEAPFAVREIARLPAPSLALVAASSARYRSLRAGHLARQHKLEELTALDREKDHAILEKESEIDALKAAADTKDTEIDALKAVCDERERLIVRQDGHIKHFQGAVADLEARLHAAQDDKARFQHALAQLPPDTARAADTLANQSIHIRNIEALVVLRDRELAALKATLAERDQSLANYAAGHAALEQAKHFSRLLAAKEAVIQSLSRACAERESVITRLAADTTGSTSLLHRFGLSASAYFREKLWRPFEAWLFTRVVEKYWMQIGVLRHHDPKPLRWDTLPAPRLPDAQLPQVAIVTPSYGQEKFVERTMRSILDQNFPRLVYAVQDGGSKDNSPALIARHAARLRHWESVRDAGQADAIRRGFAHLTPALGPDDIMAWLNSDDLIGPGVLRYVAEFFATHPDVDVIYGHRIIIDENDGDVGRWIMPRHDPHVLEWIDYIPQETLFWRKRAWDLAGGIDPSFQFALDWDLLARFQQAGCRMVRVPYCLGAFRVHSEQKTSQAIHTIGAEEMKRIRTRFHGENQDNWATIDRYARRTRFRGALVSRLLALGIRW
ncbi:MAG: glycosyltransferase, partial [Verrucomicrobia bacterium]|nr:glycosyltransferase [Verrucomicrobiota bacterium]